MNGMSALNCQASQRSQLDPPDPLKRRLSQTQHSQLTTRPPHLAPFAELHIRAFQVSQLLTGIVGDRHVAAVEAVVFFVRFCVCVCC